MEWLDDCRMPPVEATSISPTLANIPAVFVPFQPNLYERVRFHPTKFVTSEQKFSGQPATLFAGNRVAAVNA
jgi:hypothetical protein